MDYNESSAPTYTRNPLSSKHINHLATSIKKDCHSLNQSFQTGQKSRVDPTASRDSIDQMFQTSITSKIEPHLGRGKTNEKEVYISKKEHKINKLRHQINQDSNINDFQSQKTDKNPHYLSKESVKTKKSRYNTLKNQGQLSFNEYPLEQNLFSPKILKRSQSMVRKVDISTLLFRDAQRRQQKMQFKIQSDRKQKQLLTSPKINSNTNFLVLKKIRQEFTELVSQDDLNPLIALSVLQQIFNVNLNPHKQVPNYQSVQRLISILTDNQSGGELKKEKLWQFICLVIIGEVENGAQSLFRSEEEVEIKENYQYLYKERMTKERRSPSPDRLTFRPKTLECSSRLANSFRQKTCQKIDEFVENQKVTVNIKNKNYSIQDLFIIQHYKKMAENQRKKLQKENLEIQKCTFQPNVSPSASSFKAIKQKPKISLRTSKAQFLKTQYLIKNQFQKKNKTSKIQPSKPQIVRKPRQARVSTLTDQIKNAEQTIFRMSVGRQSREFSNKLKQRGYPKDQNWNAMQRSMHQECVENLKKLKGFRSQ